MRAFARAHDCGVVPDDIRPGLFAAQSALGDFLRERREEMELSLDEVAASLPITGGTVGQIERGEITRPPDEVLEGLAAALDVAVDTLRGLIPDERLENRQTIRMLANQNAIELSIYGDIGPYFWGEGASAVSVRDALKGASRTADVRIAINSRGGDVFEAHSILNQLRTHPGRVVVVVEGVAASAAATIAMGGDEIQMSEGSFMMIHEASTMTAGDASSHEQAAKLLRGMNSAIADVYASRSGVAHEEVLRMMAATTWMTGAEAKAHGFADVTTSAPAKISNSVARMVARHRRTAGPVRPQNRAAGPEVNMGLKERLTTALGVAATVTDDDLVEHAAQLRSNSADRATYQDKANAAEAALAQLKADNAELRAANKKAECDAEVARLVNEGRITADSEKAKIFRDLYTNEPDTARRVAATWGDPAVVAPRQSSGAHAPGNQSDTDSPLTPEQGVRLLPNHLQQSARTVGANKWFRANPNYANRLNVHIGQGGN